MKRDYQDLVTKAKKSRKGRKRLRYFLLIAAVALLVLVPSIYKLIEFYEDTFIVQNKIKVDRIDFEKKSVINPKYHGVDDKNQPYVIIADNAVQEKEDLVRLEEVKGEIKLNEGSTVKIRSNEGYIRTEGEKKTDLYGAVHVVHDKGYQAWTEVAHIDFGKSTIFGPQKVKAKSDQGTATGQRFMIDYENKLVTLYGKPHLIITSN
jgi:lipopolysaccharide export system protein LptC